MYQTQLLKIKIRPGKTEQVVEFMSRLDANHGPSLEAMRREGMVVESLFLERRDDGDYLYYYVKARDLMRANEVNLRATDALAQDIRRFIGETWGEIASPEPLLDLDLIREETAAMAGAMAAGTAAAKAAEAVSVPMVATALMPVKSPARRKVKPIPKPPATHVSVSVHPSGARTASVLAVTSGVIASTGEGSSTEVSTNTFGAPAIPDVSSSQAFAG